VIVYIHITLETAPNEMQCDETIIHMVAAGRSYLRALRNACVTAGKIYHGCFEMLSWPHRTSANIINICFWLLETCTKCSYFIEEDTRPGAQRLAFEVKYEYIVRLPRIYRGPAVCGWASFQTIGARCVNDSRLESERFSQNLFNSATFDYCKHFKLFGNSFTLGR